MLQFTTPRPTLHRSPKYYTEEAAYNNVCCLVHYTEAPKYYVTKAPEFYTCMYLPLPTTPRSRITTKLKRSSITLQPALPRATTPTSRSITVRKRSLKKKKCPNCSALSVTNCFPHRVTDSQLWVNILNFSLSFVSIIFFSIW
jgi:hypothetical protein